MEFLFLNSRIVDQDVVGLCEPGLPGSKAVSGRVCESFALPAESGVASDLLERVRAGDREAAAELVGRYEAVIRRRIRGRMGADMRRLIDSLDILSTVARRLDRCVHEGRVQASSDAQLWCLLKQITDNAFREKGRAFQRMRRFERDLASSSASETELSESVTAVNERARAAVGLLHRPEVHAWVGGKHGR